MFRPFRSWFRSAPSSPRIRSQRSAMFRLPEVESLEERLTPSNYMVDNGSDVDDNVLTANELSLREAVRLANADAAPDTIFFSPILSGQTIAMTGPTYAIKTPMTITAVLGNTQATNLVIDGGNARTLFQIDDGNAASRLDVVIAGLTLTHGGSPGAGGAIRVAEKLSLFNSTVANSIAATGGGIAVQSGQLIIGNSTL